MHHLVVLGVIGAHNEAAEPALVAKLRSLCLAKLAALIERQPARALGETRGRCVRQLAG